MIIRHFARSCWEDFQPVVLILVLLSGPTVRGLAAEYHIDADHGDDAASGLAADQAWKHLQFAVGRVMPGDTVLVHPGIYYEHVKLERAGSEQSPIVFRALREPGRDVVISGANRAIRSRQLKWSLDDSELGLYSVALDLEPATVLADEVNLYRFPSLDELKTLRVHNVALTGQPAPGPRHGFAWQAGKLYVRLHASGRYGSQDPNDHVMKISPPRGAGFRGDEIDSRVRANWSILTDAPAFVTLDGFVFESPGFCGVWVRRGGVTVRNCRFLGCRTGVRGWDRAEKKPRFLSDDVRVEGCEFSEYPCYQDVMEVVAEAERLSEAEQAALPKFFWWHRKAGPYSCEIGLVTAAGRRWIIRDNYIHDTLDGLSFMSLSWCEDTEVVGNRFERIFDNAVEAENHAQRLTVRNNTVVDTFEPFSYQPLNAEPWPGSIRIEHNTVGLTTEGAAFWSKPILRWKHGCFKIKVEQGFSRIPGDGFRVAENLIYFPGGNLLSLGAAALPIEGVTFENNMVICDNLGGTERNEPPTKIAFRGNASVWIASGSETGEAKSQQMLTAEQGRVFGSLLEAGIEIEATGLPKLRPGPQPPGSCVETDARRRNEKGARNQN